MHKINFPLLYIFDNIVGKFRLNVTQFQSASFPTLCYRIMKNMELDIFEMKQHNLKCRTYSSYKH